MRNVTTANAAAVTWLIPSFNREIRPSREFGEANHYLHSLHIVWIFLENDYIINRGKTNHKSAMIAWNEISRHLTLLTDTT